MSGRNTGDSITERAVGAYSQFADPRLREIVTALIQHLHEPLHLGSPLRWSSWWAGPPRPRQRRLAPRRPRV
jgi:hypothetical protein